jgi:hypothetical protein
MRWKGLDGGMVGLLEMKKNDEMGFEVADVVDGMRMEVE